MKRFKYAFQGLIQMFKRDSHFAIHLLIALIAVILGFVLSLSSTEWLFIISAVFLVLSFEALNTSIEYAVDLASSEYHELAKFSKDISAFAVALVSLYAVIVGLIIFLPKILNII